jgi:sugar phosphate isomerase/epimerase
MSYRVFAMDTYFYTSLGAYEFDARCEMLRELGYDAGYLTAWNEAAWNDVPRVAGVKAKFGINISAVYATLDVAGGDDDAVNRRIVRLVETLEGCDRIELAVRTTDKNIQKSDATHDGQMLRWLERMLPVAERRGITIALYPHMNFWLERIEDAVRLCEKRKHPRLRTVFCGYHWYAVDGQELGARLEQAAPWLASVNLCGSRRHPQPVGGMPATIEPLDEGDLDNFAFLGLLRKIGYRGEIGFQGYSVGGDAYVKLKRSLAAFRDMERRLEKHPNWAMMRAG